MILPERLEGKYEIVAKLAEGGMGAVYQVRHVHLDELRVIKVMRTALQGDRELEERFVHEARLATRLRHPNIAQLFDFDIDDEGSACIVLEFIHGLTLKDLLQRHGPPPLPLALEIGRQSLRSIGYPHRQQFVHRDISPDNLMLSRDVDGRPLVKLIDLGIAKAMVGEGAGLTTTGSFLGKVRYTSPEQLEALELDGRSDLYSFGVVLYELVTGQRPIEGTTASSIVAGHLLHPPRSFDETDPDRRVPAALREIVLQALQKKRQDRIATAETFSRRLGKLQSRFPLTGRELEAIFDPLPPATAEGRPVEVAAPTPAERSRPGTARAGDHTPAAAAAGTTRRLDRPPLVEAPPVEAPPVEAPPVETTPSPTQAAREIEERRARRREEERLERRLAPIAQGIEGFLRLGELERAAAALERATMSWGDTSVFADLRRRLAELQRQRAANSPG